MFQIARNFVKIARRRSHSLWTSVCVLVVGVMLAGIGQQSFASVLPEDRTDFLYHRYEGGGVTIDGPSVLIRKSVGKSLSLAANYYVDMISSASIDVITTASPYKEERTQYSLSGVYLRGNTTATRLVTTQFAGPMILDFFATIPGKLMVLA